MKSNTRGKGERGKGGEGEGVPFHSGGWIRSEGTVEG